MTLGPLGVLDPVTLGLSDPWSLGPMAVFAGKGRAYEVAQVYKTKKNKRAAFEWSAVSGTAFLQKADLARERN